MGDEQHGHATRAGQAGDQLGDSDLVADVEAGERFVEQQQARFADDGLGQGQALQLAA